MTWKVGIVQEPDWTPPVRAALENACKTVFSRLPGITWEYTPDVPKVVPSELLNNYDGVLLLTRQLNEDSFAGATRIAGVARWGVGFDTVDTKAATAAGVAIMLTPAGVQLSVAEGGVALLLMLVKQLRSMDGNAREGKWRGDLKLERNICIEGRVAGSIGGGNIGAAMMSKLKALGCHLLCADQYLPRHRAAEIGCKIVDLDTLLKESDFVFVNCPLTAETTGLIGARKLALMKPTAYLINTARGAIVQEAPLVEALKAGKLGGAGLDVFESEPLTRENPLTQFPNVVLTPHTIAWTEELMAGNSRQACENLVALFQRRRPLLMANPDVWDSDALQAKLRRYPEAESEADGTLSTAVVLPTASGDQKPNRLKDAVRVGKMPIGTMLWEFKSRGVARLVEGSGVDFCVIDMEHSGFGIDTVSDLLQYFRGTTVTTFVRVPSIEYHWIARVMDAGAQGVMLPNVRTMEEVHTAVNALKFKPVGKRGLGLGHAQTDYGAPLPNIPAWLEAANESSTLICQIESQEALDILDEIAAHPAVDVLWVGQFDLTNSLGCPGDLHCEVFYKALEAVVAAAKRHGKASAIQPGNITQALEWKDIGFTIMSYGVDAMLYKSALAGGVDALRQACRDDKTP